MKRKEKIISIEADQTMIVCGSNMPEITRFKITTNEGTEVGLTIDQLENYKLGDIVEVNFDAVDMEGESK